MIIGGLEGLSLIDYPGNLCAIVFTQGCNFRCPFCYNPMLTGLKAQRDYLSEDGLFAFLKDRQGKLDGVVVTGGEPTIHVDLPEFIKQIKDLGFLVKLDTNGTNPDMLSRLFDLALVDYVAMDLKAPPAKYMESTGTKNNWPKIEKSIKIIRQSGLPYEFRTTVTKKLLSENDILIMAQIIKGASKWYLQGFVASGELLNPEFKDAGRYTKIELQNMAKLAAEIAGHCEIRGY